MKLPNTEPGEAGPQDQPGFLARHPFLVMICVGLALAALFFQSAEDLETLPPEKRGTPEEIPPLPQTGETVALAPGEERANPGPWGGVRRTRLYLDPPGATPPPDGHRDPTPQWRLPGVDRAALTNLLLRPAFSAKDREWVLGAPGGEHPAGGLVLRPTAAAVLGLSPGGRAEWYGILSQWPENATQRTPWIFATNRLAEVFSQSGLAVDTLVFLDGLLYKKGNALAFADLGLATATLTNQLERQRLVQTLGRRPVEHLKLFVPHGMDVEPLLDYWLKDPDGGRLERLFRAMARKPRGATVDIVHLLPPLARARLHTASLAEEDPSASRRGALWGALNFFSPAPDDRFLDAGQVEAALREDYTPVVDDPAFGDVVLFRNAEGAIVLAGAYIADDALFTRLDGAVEEPWTILGFDDLLASHSWERLNVSAHRLKRHAAPAKPAATPDAPTPSPGPI